MSKTEDSQSDKTHSAKKIRLDLDSPDRSSFVSKPMAILSKEYTRKTIGTVPVYIAEIVKPKLASKCISDLKEIFPLEDLSHLKRIKRCSSKETGLTLQIIICRVLEYELANKKNFSLKDILPNFNTEGLGQPIIATVPKTQPLTREQFVQASQLWPTNFHEDKYITRLLSGELFDNVAVRKINKYMAIAIKAANTGRNNGMVAMGAVVVDPLKDNVIAIAYDLRCHGHPLHHAVMVVIDLIAQSQSGGTWNIGYQQDSGSWTIPETLDTLATNDFKNIKSKSKEIQEISTDSLIVENKTGPYLCTGYDLYVTLEPCIMCAMALVHSRIRRVFYGCKDPDTGALGSKYSLHIQDNINHHFEAFCGVLENECRELHTH